MTFATEINNTISDTNKVLRNTFITLALTMITTVIGVGIGVEFAATMMANGLATFVIILVLGLGLMLGAFLTKESYVGLIFLFAFTVVMGIDMGPMIAMVTKLANGPQLIMLAALGTASVLVAMTVVAMTSKRDFSNLKGILFGILIGIIVLELLNAFVFKLPAIAVLISAVAVILFSIYILVDVQDVVSGRETNYIVATIGIYLDIINLFIHLLRILAMVMADSDD